MINYCTNLSSQVRQFGVTTKPRNVGEFGRENRWVTEHLLSFILNLWTTECNIMSTDNVKKSKFETTTFCWCGFISLEVLLFHHKSSTDERSMFSSIGNTQGTCTCTHTWGLSTWYISAFCSQWCRVLVQFLPRAPLKLWYYTNVIITIIIIQAVYVCFSCCLFTDEWRYLWCYRHLVPVLTVSWCRVSLIWSLAIAATASLWSMLPNSSANWSADLAKTCMKMILSKLLTVRSMNYSSGLSLWTGDCNLRQL